MEISASKIPAVAEANPKGESKGRSPLEIQEWIVAYIAELLEVDPEEVDITVPFDTYGLDSSAAVVLTGDLENWLETEIEPTLLYDYPTVEALVRHLSQTRSFDLI